MSWAIEVRAESAVVAFNPEMADLDHPHGEVVGERFYMHAEDADGHTRAWGWFADREACERAFEFVAPPIDEWAIGRPAYGSPAWTEARQDALDEDAERRAYDVPRSFEPTAFHRIY